MGGASSYKYPEPVEVLNNKEVASIHAGATHGGALTKDGRAFMWGKNEFHQLGIDSSGQYLGGASLDAEHFPRLVESLAEQGEVRFLCYQHTTYRWCGACP